MKLNAKLISSILVICLALGCLGIGFVQKYKIGEPDEMLRLWYADDAMSDYVASISLAYYEKTGVRVIPTLVSGVEYLEQIYAESVEQVNYPDLYIASNDVLEKAYLAGVASEIANNNDMVSLENYTQTALNAVTYDEKIVGYPLSFETSIFVYNHTYLCEIAENMIHADARAKLYEEDPTAEYMIEDIILSEEEIVAKAEEILPNDFTEIRAIADQYDAPEQVEAFVRWDVSDVFYNYFFVGDSLNMGGPTGDDPTQIVLYNAVALKSLEVYQEMQQFFSIDPDEVDYESVVDDFINGRIVFSVMTTDGIQKIEQAKEEGIFQYEYEVAMIPDINSEILSRSMSVTNALVVNGFSSERDLANEFAEFIVTDCQDTLYPMTGKVSAKEGVVYDNPKVAKTLEEYSYSVPIPKMIEASNFWVQLEICLTRVWALEDAGEQLRALTEQIMTQVTGEPYVQESFT